MKETPIKISLKVNLLSTSCDMVEPHGKCGARTRQGTPCPSKPVHGRTRCRMHGGTSRRGIAHPNYRTGKWTKEAIARRKAAAEARRRSRRKIDEFMAALETGRISKVKKTALGRILDRSEIRQLIRPDR